MKNFYKALDVAVSNLKRLNRLRIAGKLIGKEMWNEFFLYRDIVKKQDTGVYTQEVNEIINKKIRYNGE